MSTHDFVLQTFIIYLFVKALIFLPLAWIATVMWWADRSSATPSDS
jgi:hypothetical protein